MSARRSSRAENSAVSFPEHLTWHRVHPISPVIEGWQIVVGLLAVVTIRNADAAVSLYRAFTSRSQEINAGMVLPIIAGILAVLLIGAAYLALSWRANTYAIDDDTVYVRRGILMRSVRHARLARIQSVDIVHPLLGRIVGLGTLVIEVAGGADSRFVLQYLRSSELDALRRDLLERVREAHSATDGASAASEKASEKAADAELMTAQPVASAPAVTEATTGAAAGPAPAPGPAPVTGGQAAATAAAASAAPLGFEDALAAPQRTRARNEPVPLFVVPLTTIVTAILRSGSAVAAALLALTGLIGTLVVVAVFLKQGKAVTFASVSGFLTFVLVGASFLLNRVNAAWNFQAAMTPAGVRVRHGLTTDVSSTLPPGRIHAITLERGMFWRGPDLWKVDTMLAGRLGSTVESGSAVPGDTTVLPAGSRATALGALWLIQPDLGVEDPSRLLHALMDGGGPSAQAQQEDAQLGFVRASSRTRIFSPIAWRWNAVVLTDTCVMVRDRRWGRSVTVIPYERIQSLSVEQGPVARRCQVAKVQIDMVGGPRNTPDMDLAQARALRDEIAARALARARKEKSAVWMERADRLSDAASPEELLVASHAPAARSDLHDTMGS